MKFYKYQGTGNDFIMIDDRKNKFPEDNKIIAQLCDRRFGIGADGLILLQEPNHNQFRMVYYNADGGESTMCGNGGRCFVRFLNDLDLIKKNTTFSAIDGKHYAEVFDDYIKLQMHDVEEVEHKDGYFYADTGSPHHVLFEEHIKQIDVKAEGAKIRYSELYPEGVNVNFVEELTSQRLFVRTYERGVEDETLSCGTGVTAAALAYASATDNLLSNEVHIKTLGGNLTVSFNKNEKGFQNIFLIGPAEFVFQGKIKV